MSTQKTAPIKKTQLLAVEDEGTVAKNNQMDRRSKKSNQWLAATLESIGEAAIDQTADSVLITDNAGKIVYVNPAFEKITGYSRTEAVGQTPHILRSGEHDAAFFQELWTTINAGEVWHGRCINQKKDATTYTVDSTITPLRDKLGNITNYVEVQRDVTRELQLEEQYRQAQKMEAIGQLTGGIAHDFNNILTGIIGYAELAILKLEPDDPVRDMIDNIVQSGQRAAKLVSQLLAFSRKQIIAPEILNLNTVVTGLQNMLPRIIGEHIQLKTNLASDLHTVKMDPTQVEQVIFNLAVNARDAMSKGGWLTIETANTVLEKEYVANQLELQPGQYVLLTVSDTGKGINKEVQARIFEPFFTTKEQGTGLGLATVFGIVKQNGGDIHVYSEEGYGTTFKIYLPCTQEVSAPPCQINQTNGTLHGTETILLAEDDEMVRKAVMKILHQHDYTVLTAVNGREALELAQEHNGDIDLVLTDVVMPEAGGITLANRLRKIRPDIKTLFISGYSDSAVQGYGVLEPDLAFLQKPFTPVDLACKVREVLDSPRTQCDLRSRE